MKLPTTLSLVHDNLKRYAQLKWPLCTHPIEKAGEQSTLQSCTIGHVVIHTQM